jgi:hypothetical protein
MIPFFMMGDLNVTEERRFTRVLFVAFIVSAGEVFRLAVGCDVILNFLTFCRGKLADFAVE